MNARGRGNQGNDGPQTHREAPPGDNRQRTNSSTRGGANRRGFGVPPMRGGARPPPQSHQQGFDAQTSEYPPITTASDSREKRRNFDRPVPEITNVNIISQTQDVRQSRVGRNPDTYAHGNAPTEQHVEPGNRPRQKRGKFLLT